MININGASYMRIEKDRKRIRNKRYPARRRDYRPEYGNVLPEEKGADPSPTKKG